MRSPGRYIADLGAELQQRAQIERIYLTSSAIAHAGRSTGSTKRLSVFSAPAEEASQRFQISLLQLLALLKVRAQLAAPSAGSQWKDDCKY